MSGAFFDMGPTLTVDVVSDTNAALEDWFHDGMLKN